MWGIALNRAVRATRRALGSVVSGGARIKFGMCVRRVMSARPACQLEPEQGRLS
jgi:hypothetical protein